MFMYPSNFFYALNNCPTSAQLQFMYNRKHNNLTKTRLLEELYTIGWNYVTRL